MRTATTPQPVLGRLHPRERGPCRQAATTGRYVTGCWSAQQQAIHRAITDRGATPPRDIAHPVAHQSARRLATAASLLATTCQVAVLPLRVRLCATLAKGPSPGAITPRVKSAAQLSSAAPSRPRCLIACTMERSWVSDPDWCSRIDRHHPILQAPDAGDAARSLFTHSRPASREHLAQRGLQCLQNATKLAFQP
jgi:hypothetical protein